LIFEVWVNGYTDGIAGVLPIYFGKHEANSFDEACKIGLDSIGMAPLYNIFTTRAKFYDNKEDAIKNTEFSTEKYIDRSTTDVLIYRRILDDSIIIIRDLRDIKQYVKTKDELEKLDEITTAFLGATAMNYQRTLFKTHFGDKILEIIRAVDKFKEKQNDNTD